MACVNKPSTLLYRLSCTVTASFKLSFMRIEPVFFLSQGTFLPLGWGAQSIITVTRNTPDFAINTPTDHMLASISWEESIIVTRNNNPNF